MLIYLQIIESDADRDKFEHLYYYYRDYMFHIANRIVKNEYDAEDAVHSAFESIAKNIGKLGNVECSKTRAYIVIIVEHKSIDIEISSPGLTTRKVQMIFIMECPKSVDSSVLYIES